MQSQGRPEKHQLSYKIATEHNGLPGSSSVIFKCELRVLALLGTQKFFPAFRFVMIVTFL